MRFYSLLLCVASVASGFITGPSHPQRLKSTALFSNKDEGDVKQQHALAVGTLVEFEEKKRVHIGTILTADHKSSGGARYKIEDTHGKTFDIADKAVTFSTPAPNSPKKFDELLTQLAAAQEASEEELYTKLDVSVDLLEMAWEEAADEEATSHELTAKSFVQLVHSHAASAIEEYMAWKLLKSERAHVFFKDLKHNGRVLSFKAKARKAGENAKQAFCSSHDDAEFCLV